MSILAARGVDVLALLLKISPRNLLLILILISLPTSYYFYVPLWKPDIVLIDQSISSAYGSLKELPQGALFVPLELNDPILLSASILSHKQIVWPGFKTDELVNDYATVQNNSLPSEERMKIIFKYHVRYFLTPRNSSLDNV